MNRLQKKCVLATVGVHLLLLVILVVGPAFFQPRPETEQVQVLDVIPSTLVDAVVNSGVRHAQPPAPVYHPPEPPAPKPEPPAPKPKPVVMRHEPAPRPVKRETVKPEPVKRESEKVKPDLKRVEHTTKTEPHKIKVNLKRVVRGGPSHPDVPNDSHRAATLRKALQNLKKNFSSGTTVDMPGDSSVAYANYANAVVSKYKHAWLPPDGMESDNAMVKFKVTIASDGTVISARITEPSGDANVDAAVRRLLERVTFIAPFPEGATGKERTYTIHFNATRRTLE